MRKTLSLLLLGGCLAAPLSAQTTFGVVAGLVSAQWSISPGPSTGEDSRIGFAIGASVLAPLGNGLAFAPELMYVQKGVTDDTETPSISAAVSYIELPVLFRYSLSTSGSARPFLLAGPELSIKAGCTLSQASASVGCSDGGEFAVTPKSTDYGLVLGAGVAVQRFSVSLRYDLGLANIDPDASDGGSVKNSTWMLLVGVHF